METMLQQLGRECPRLIENLGVRVVEQDYSEESFGNSYVVLEGAGLRLRVARDRSLVSADISPTVEIRWWPVEMLGELLGVQTPVSDRSATALCSFLTENHSRLSKLVAEDMLADTRQKLKEVSERRTAAMLRRRR